MIKQLAFFVLVVFPSIVNVAAQNISDALSTYNRMHTAPMFRPINQEYRFRYSNAKLVQSTEEIAKLKIKSIKIAVDLQNAAQMNEKGSITYTFDKNGNVLSVSFKDGLGKVLASSLYINTYDEIGNLKSIKISISKANYDLYCVQLYDHSGLLLRREVTKQVVEHKRNGEIAEPIQIDREAPHSEGLLRTYEEAFIEQYAYATDGLLVSYKLTHANSKENRTYGYDSITRNRLKESRSVIEKIYYLVDSDERKHDLRDSLKTTQTDIDYTYDAKNGFLLKIDFNVNNDKTNYAYTYNQFGYLVSDKVVYNGIEIQSKHYWLDKNNELVVTENLKGDAVNSKTLHSKAREKDKSYTVRDAYDNGVSYGNTFKQFSKSNLLLIDKGTSGSITESGRKNQLSSFIHSYSYAFYH